VAVIPPFAFPSLAIAGGAVRFQKAGAAHRPLAAGQSRADCILIFGSSAKPFFVRAIPLSLER
jgi:hypothetical protein